MTSPTHSPNTSKVSATCSGSRYARLEIDHPRVARVEQTPEILRIDAGPQAKSSSLFLPPGGCILHVAAFFLPLHLRSHPPGMKPECPELWYEPTVTPTMRRSSVRPRAISPPARPCQSKKRSLTLAPSRAPRSTGRRHQLLPRPMRQRTEAPQSHAFRFGRERTLRNCALSRTHPCEHRRCQNSEIVVETNSLDPQGEPENTSIFMGSGVFGETAPS